jgi:hypothetical protein
VVINVSEEHIASIFRAEEKLEVVCSTDYKHKQVCSSKTLKTTYKTHCVMTQMITMGNQRVHEIVEMCIDDG